MTFASDIALLTAVCRDAAERGLAHAGRLILRTLKAYAAARRNRADLEVLRRLDDHLLEDIGLNAHEVRRAILARRSGRNLTDGWGA